MGESDGGLSDLNEGRDAVALVRRADNCKLSYEGERTEVLLLASELEHPSTLDDGSGGIVDGEEGPGLSRRGVDLDGEVTHRRLDDVRDGIEARGVGVAEDGVGGGEMEEERMERVVDRERLERLFGSGSRESRRVGVEGVENLLRVG